MGDNEVRANDGVNLTIDEGEFVAIVGKSGSGKSTIMNIIGALDIPTSGQYILNGQDVSKIKGDELAGVRNKMIGFIFQQYNLLPKQILIENVELPLLYAGLGKKQRRTMAMEALKTVGLEDKWKNYPNQLSGGQQQRGAVARALAGNPSLILADEPTGALDSRTSKELLDFLRKLNEDGNTIVLITHDRNVAEQARRVVGLKDGKIVFDQSIEDYRK
ncbi:MAG TPA: ABC transporter ATP-binding protein [Clostridiales bacterium]|nr:ABC transporter ATP-binding protein [Clostridiales bacterium]